MTGKMTQYKRMEGELILCIRLPQLLILLGPGFKKNKNPSMEENVQGDQVKKVFILCFGP